MFICLRLRCLVVSLLAVSVVVVVAVAIDVAAVSVVVAIATAIFIADADDDSILIVVSLVCGRIDDIIFVYHRSKGEDTDTNDAFFYLDLSRLSTSHKMKAIKIVKSKQTKQQKRCETQCNKNQMLEFAPLASLKSHCCCYCCC